MKCIKYILSIAILSIVMLGLNAQEIKVSFADQVAKKAKVYNEKGELLAKTSQEGMFNRISGVNHVRVAYKGVEKAFTLDKSTHSLVLLPSEKQLAKLIKKAPSVLNCEMYVAAYPQGKNITQVKSTLEEEVYELAFSEAVNNYDFSQLNAYLDAYPEGRYAAKATKTIEVVSWQMARFQNSQDSYSDFIARYPDSKAIPMAKEKLASIK